jgi:hypothetical protein
MDLYGYKETAVPVFEDNCKLCFIEDKRLWNNHVSIFTNLETVDYKIRNETHFTVQITQWAAVGSDPGPIKSVQIIKTQFHPTRFNIFLPPL